MSSSTVPRDKQVPHLREEVDDAFGPLSDAVDAASNVLEDFGQLLGDPNAQAAIIGPKLREVRKEVYEQVLSLCGHAVQTAAESPENRKPDTSPPAKAVDDARLTVSLRGGGNTAEDLLNDFEWKLAGLVQIAETTQAMWDDIDPKQRWRLGMTDRTAEHVWSLFYDFDDMRELIMQMENRAWRSEEVRDAS